METKQQAIRLKQNLDSIRETGFDLIGLFWKNEVDFIIAWIDLIKDQYEEKLVE